MLNKTQTHTHKERPLILRTLLFVFDACFFLFFFLLLCLFCKCCALSLFSPRPNLMCVKFCCQSRWLDAESGTSPNNGCTLHQWEHPFQQSVPHMAPRPLLHALSRRRVSFMLPDSGSLRASRPSDQLFWSDPASWQRKDFSSHIFSLKNKKQKTESLSELSEELSPEQVNILRSTWRWRFFFFCAWTMLVISGGIHLLPSFLA